ERTDCAGYIQIPAESDPRVVRRAGGMTYSMERRIGMLRLGVLVSAFTLLSIRASAQSAISTHSGLIHFFEGAISIDGRAVHPINGRFPEIPEGSDLNTNEGKAEI